jgi:hypothetical protein
MHPLARPCHSRAPGAKFADQQPAKLLVSRPEIAKYPQFSAVLQYDPLSKRVLGTSWEALWSADGALGRL